MKGNSERRCPLSTKLLMVQLGSLCLALTIFLAGLYGGRWLLDNVYLQPEAMHRRENRRDWTCRQDVLSDE